jgi:hypothetical protein
MPGDAFYYDSQYLTLTILPKLSQARSKPKPAKNISTTIPLYPVFPLP